jgi:type II secretory pathway component PulF
MPRGRRKKADIDLVLAVACGASPESAALKAGVSRRTVYRRLKDPAFCQQVKEMRSSLVARSTSMLTAAGLGAVKTLTTLQDSAESEAVRLRAAQAVISLGHKLRETVEYEERLRALEKQMEAQSQNRPTEGSSQ